MSCCDWLLYSAFRGLLIATVILMGTGNALSNEQKDAEQDNPNYTDGNKRNAAQQFALITLNRDKPRDTNWGKPNCKQPGNHDEADLCQQIEAVHTAQYTFVANGVQEVLALLALVGLVVTGIFTNRAANAAVDAAKYGRTAAIAGIRSAKAARESVSAARAQIAITERNARLESRAYVHVEEISILDENPKHQLTFAIRFKNFGNTPADKVTFIAGTTNNVIGNPSFDLPERKPLYYSLGPGQEHTTTANHSLALWHIIRPQLLNGGRTYYLFGEIRYFDAFQDQANEEPRFTRFRSEMILVDEGIAKGIFVFSDEGNEAN